MPDGKGKHQSKDDVTAVRMEILYHKMETVLKLKTLKNSVKKKIVLQYFCVFLFFNFIDQFHPLAFIVCAFTITIHFCSSGMPYMLFVICESFYFLF